MVCGIDFFGADHVLFASDCPFDKEKGPGYIRSTIAVLEQLNLSPGDHEKISHKNAQAMFGVT
jgi:predicted TIM-barrel fold metal-dependent hydrolase